MRARNVILGLVHGDLFGFVPSDETPPELRLSHLVSKWLVFNSDEASDEVDLSDEEIAALSSHLPRFMSLSKVR